MTKAELVTAISKRTGIDKMTISATLEAFMDVTQDTLKRGNAVHLRMFGSFCLKHHAQKNGRNIAKNTTIVIPEHYTPSFKPAIQFVKEVKSVKVK
ncbi:integration host factor subunit beta [Bacteroidia bacterium]|nr:integration host factor subunit beta [Bacteroidia bacterium]